MDAELFACERARDSRALAGFIGPSEAGRQGCVTEDGVRVAGDAKFERESVPGGDGQFLWRLGRLAEARALLLEAAEVADLVPTLAPLAWAGLAYNCHEAGAHEESSVWAGRVEAAMARGGESSYLRLWLCLLGCRNQLRAGRTDEAVEAADRAAATARGSGILEPCIVPWHGAAVEAYLAAGKLEQAGELVAHLDELCQPLPCHAPRAVGAWGAAIVAWRRGDMETAEAGFNQALAHNAKVAMPLAQAETLVAYGRFLRQTGRPSVARQTLHRALQVLEPTGAGDCRR